MRPVQVRLLETSLGAVEIVETGAGADVLILVHASASGPRALLRLAEQLTANRCRVILPALAGYGATRVADDGDRLSANVAIVRRAVAERAGGRCLLVGHSMGGLVALHATAAGLAIDGLAVIEPVAFGVLEHGDPDDDAAAAWDRGIAAQLLRDMAGGQPEQAIAPFVEAWNEMAWPALPESARSGLIAQAPVIAADVAMVAAAAAAPAAWQEIRCPTLIIDGERSPVPAQRICGRLAARLPAGRQQRIAGAGHMGPVFQPERYAAAIGQFWASLVK